jgi:hypothetical protein
MDYFAGLDISGDETYVCVLERRRRGGSLQQDGVDDGCGANAGDQRKKALGSLTRITRQALHSKSQARFCF